MTLHNLRGTRLFALAFCSAVLFTTAANAAILGIDGSPTSGDPNLRSWFRADMGIGVASGAAVPRWNDASDGLGVDTLRDVMHGTAANQPLFIAAESSLNNQPVVRFDGANDYLRRTVTGTAAGAQNGAALELPVIGNTNRTVFAVLTNVQRRAGTETGTIGVEHALHWGSNTNDMAYGVLVEHNGAGTSAHFANHYWGGFDPGTTASGMTPRVVTFSYDNALFAPQGRAGGDQYWVNGRPAGVIDVQATGTLETNVPVSANVPVAYPPHQMKTGADVTQRQFALGSRLSGFSEGFRGDIAEVIIYDQALSAAQRTSVEGYLANRYGLAFNPPGNTSLPLVYDASNIAASRSSLTFNGSSAQPAVDVDGAPILRVNNHRNSETGAIWTTRPVSLASDYSFSTQFEYHMSSTNPGSGVDCCGDLAGADGMLFTIHQDPRKDMAMGETGGSMGVSGVVDLDSNTAANRVVNISTSITPSLQVELDTWNSGVYDVPANGTNGNHIGVNVSSARYSIAQTAPGAVPQHADDTADPAVNTRNVWVDYDGNLKVMQVYVSTTNVKPIAPVIYKQVNLSRIFNSPDVYVGFAGATGGARESHDIRYWQFDSQPSASAPADTFPSRFTFQDFSDVSQFTMNVSGASLPPSSVGGRLRLTDNIASQGTSAVLTDPVILPRNFTFSTDFRFEVSLPAVNDPDGPGADGFTFFLATGPRGAGIVGGVGGAIGIDGISANLVAIEFDTWNTGSFDPDGTLPTHIGIDISGVANGLPGPSSLARAAVPRFNDGGIHHAWIEYDGVTKQMSVFLSTTDIRPVTPQLTATVDVGALLGQTNEEVFLGFSAGTGGAVNRHEILSWHFVPEPSSYALAMFGLFGFGVIARRRRKAK